MFILVLGDELVGGKQYREWVDLVGGYYVVQDWIGGGREDGEE